MILHIKFKICHIIISLSKAPHPPLGSLIILMILDWRLLKNIVIFELVYHLIYVFTHFCAKFRLSSMIRSLSRSLLSSPACLVMSALHICICILLYCVYIVAECERIYLIPEIC